MTLHIIALNTYGSHRVTDPRTKQTVSAYKMGYSQPTALILLSLFGEQARNVTPRQASYHYIHLQSEVSVHSGFILIQVDEPQLDKVLKITRTHPSDFLGVYLWRDEQWWIFPTQQGDFQTAIGRSGPAFNPLSYRPRTIDGQRPSPVSGIIAEKSQRSADDTPWWWLTGDTYPHREALKSAGCRWSKLRKAWYFIGLQLPQAVENLLDKPQETPEETPLAPEPEDDAPCSLAEASAILGLPAPGPDRNPRLDEPAPTRRFAIGEKVYVTQSVTASDGTQLHKGWDGRIVEFHAKLPQSLVKFGSWTAFVQDEFLASTPPHQFELGQRVYLAHTLRVSMDGPKEGQLLPMDAAGVVVRRYEYKPSAQYQHRLAYDVKFDDHGLHSLFQDALRDEPTAIPGIVRHETLHVMFGVRIEDVMRAEMERRQSIPQDYKLLDELADVEPEPPQIDDVPQENAAPEDAAPPPIRRLPAHEPDKRLAQITMTPRTSPRAPIQRTNLARIEQRFVGELSGSISGSVYCYGYALHKDMCIVLNLGGPHMAVEAIRARLNNGEVVNLTHHNGPSLDLEPGWDEEGAPLKGAYTVFVQNLPEAKFTSMILCHKHLVEPRYQAQGTTYIIRTDQEQAQAHLLKHLRAMLNVALFDEWDDYLWQAGEIANLLGPTRSEALDVLALHTDAEAWMRVITGGLARQLIRLPE
jgi:hypothetical protein